jgi:DNA-damage-inducible protein J
MKTETVRARISPDLKENAESVLKELGLSTTEAIRGFYTQITLKRGLPFEVRLPNEETLAAIKEAGNRDSGEKMETTSALFKSLGI